MECDLCWAGIVDQHGTHVAPNYQSITVRSTASVTWRSGLTSTTRRCRSEFSSLGRSRRGPSSLPSGHRDLRNRGRCRRWVATSPSVTRWTGSASRCTVMRTLTPATSTKQSRCWQNNSSRLYSRRNTVSHIKHTKIVLIISSIQKLTNSHWIRHTLSWINLRRNDISIFCFT